MLFGYVFQLCLRAVKESLAGKSSRADGYLRLIDVVAGAAQVVFDAECHFDAHLLVGAKGVERYVGRIEEAYRAYCKCYGDEIFLCIAFECLIHYIANSGEQRRQQNDASVDVDAAQYQRGKDDSCSDVD